MLTFLGLISLPLLAILFIYPLRRQRIGGLLTAFITLLIARGVWNIDPELTVIFLGRILQLPPTSKIILTVVLVSIAMLFLISAFAPSFIAERSRGITPGKRAVVEHGGTQGQEGRTFYPVGLAVISLFIIASLVHHLAIIAIFLQTAAILTVFIIQGGRLASTRAALRFLTMVSLAAPLLMLGAWQIDQQQLNPTQVDNAPQTALLVGLGFALWLAVVPFHSWMSSIATDSYPASAAFVLSAFPAISFAVIIHLLHDADYLVALPQFSTAIILGGLATALLGGLLASIQRGFSELLGYAALYDLGCLVIILGLGHTAGNLTLLLGLLGRMIGLLLLAASLSAVHARHADDGFANLTHMARRMPIAVAGLVLGGFTLAGLPLTAGFASRMALFSAIATMDMRWLGLLILGGGGVVLGYGRGLYATLTPSALTPPSKLSPPESRLLWFQEPPVLLLIILALMLITLAWGLFPHTLLDTLQQNIIFEAAPLP